MTRLQVLTIILIYLAL